MKVMLTVVYMRVVTGMTGPLRTSQTEAGSIKDKKLINVSLQSFPWIITKYYFY